MPSASFHPCARPQRRHRALAKNLGAISGLALTAFVLLGACQAGKPGLPVAQVEVDTVIINGLIFSGADEEPAPGVVGIRGDKISFLASSLDREIVAGRTIDAAGMLVTPGFIDPHTHSDAELKNPAASQNLNYLTQGVTTVFIGNDGAGAHNVGEIAERLLSIGIGTNVGFLVGHGAVRKHVMGNANRPPNKTELSAMKVLVESAMAEGALGLSSGLYYAPGSFADTAELVELAKVAARHGGLYESHLRDESSYNIGLLASVTEALDIGRDAGLPVHISHIKALGVDVWGESSQVIRMIEHARNSGLRVTADQYPWQASGTHLDNALVSRWAMAGTEADFHARLGDPQLRPGIVAEMRNNLRIRGGAEAILIAECPEPSYIGKTLAEVASERDMNPIEIALRLLVSGDTRVISFNMNPDDIRAFMIQPWVMTSSDGNDGHPRKYASFPRKYRSYVVEQGVMPVHTFVHRSTGLVADTFGVSNRGYLKLGYFADIAIIDPENFAPQASFEQWNKLSTGVNYLFVNGALAIDNSSGSMALSGAMIQRRR